MKNLFNKFGYNKIKLSPHDFKYEPINSIQKVLGLEHNPRVRSVVEPPISSTQWCIKERIRLGELAKANLLVGV
jgi:hypothetical protein